VSASTTNTITWGTPVHLFAKRGLLLALSSNSMSWHHIRGCCLVVQKWHKFFVPIRMYQNTQQPNRRKFHVLFASVQILFGFGV
jgi:hypothetical protein